MPKPKYGRYLIKGPFKVIDHYTGTSIVAHENEYNANIAVGYHCLANTKFRAEKPHTHDFHELLCFIGGNPLNIKDFGAELEKHVIKSPTVVSIPPGLIHCPLIVKRVDKPVVFLEVSLTPKFGTRFLNKKKAPKKSRKGPRK
jgi:hypothetical protein